MVSNLSESNRGASHSSLDALPVSTGNKKLQREAIAACAEEASVAITRGLNASQELMCSMSAAVLVTGRVVLMLRHWHTGARSFANIQRCPVTTKHLHR